MSKTPTGNAAARAEKSAESQAATPHITLDEFCQVLSKTDRRVELISAFHFHERSAGRTSGNESEFRARLEKFLKKPV